MKLQYSYLEKSNSDLSKGNIINEQKLNNNCDNQLKQFTHLTNKVNSVSNDTTVVAEIINTGTQLRWKLRKENDLVLLGVISGVRRIL